MPRQLIDRLKLDPYPSKMGTIRDFIAKSETTGRENAKRIEAEYRSIPKLAERITELALEFSELSQRYWKRLVLSEADSYVIFPLLEKPSVDMDEIVFFAEPGIWKIVDDHKRSLFPIQHHPGHRLTLDFLSYKGGRGLEPAVQRIEDSILARLKPIEDHLNHMLALDTEIEMVSELNRYFDLGKSESVQ